MINTKARRRREGTVRALHARGASLDEIIGWLRRDEDSQMWAVVALHDAGMMEFNDAKAAVVDSRIWADRLDGNLALHAAIDAYLEELGAETPKSPPSLWAKVLAWSRRLTR